MEQDRLEKRQDLIPDLHNFFIALGFAWHAHQSPRAVLECEKGLNALVERGGCEEGWDLLEGLVVCGCRGEDFFGEGEVLLEGVERRERLEGFQG